MQCSIFSSNGVEDDDKDDDNKNNNKVAKINVEDMFLPLCLGQELGSQQSL